MFTNIARHVFAISANGHTPVVPCICFSPPARPPPNRPREVCQHNLFAPWSMVQERTTDEISAQTLIREWDEAKTLHRPQKYSRAPIKAAMPRGSTLRITYNQRAQHQSPTPCSPKLWGPPSKVGCACPMNGHAHPTRHDTFPAAPDNRASSSYPMAALTCPPTATTRHSPRPTPRAGRGRAPTADPNHGRAPMHKRHTLHPRARLIGGAYQASR